MCLMCGFARVCWGSGGWCRSWRCSHDECALALAALHPGNQPQGVAGQVGGADDKRKKAERTKRRCPPKEEAEYELKKKLTLDFERVSPLESIQTYSAMIWPFWSSLRYLLSCEQAKSQFYFHEWRGGFGRPREAQGARTVSVLEVKAYRLD